MIVIQSLLACAFIYFLVRCWRDGERTMFWSLIAIIPITIAVIVISQSVRPMSQ